MDPDDDVDTKTNRNLRTPEPSPSQQNAGTPLPGSTDIPQPRSVSHPPKSAERRSARQGRQRAERQRLRHPAQRVLDLIVDRMEGRFDRMIEAIGRDEGLRSREDIEDLRQEVREWLCRHYKKFDPLNPGWRRWLSTRVKWIAADLRRRDARRLGSTSELTDPYEFEEQAGRNTAKTPARPYLTGVVDEPHESSWPLARAWLRQALDRAGLNTDQRMVIEALCQGTDLSLRDLAILLERPPDTFRQDKKRAIDKLQKVIGLDDEERDVFMYWWHAIPQPTIAARLGHTEDQTRKLLFAAREKIDRFLYPEGGMSW